MTDHHSIALTVCGSGAMGSQIALVGALAGHTVTLYDIDAQRLDAAVAELRAQADRRVSKGRLTPEQAAEAFARLSVTTVLAEAADKADFMIEAIIEDLGAKQALFAEFASLAPAHCVLATNSSSIVSSQLVGDIAAPERICNMHFFNPALVMELVEVVQGAHTSEATVERAMSLATSMGKHPVQIEREIFGFVVNRILTAIFDEALSLHEEGIASFEDIDVAVRKGLGHPIGPFALLDLTGIDVNYHIKTLQAQESGRPEDGPARSLVELYEAGKLGRKSGEGFYTYEESGR
ncbi:3-hydroxyacyl-CoA dehydrogenase [Leucobacter sp. BZR 635]